MKKITVITILLFISVTSFAQAKKETLTIPWPAELKLRVGSEEDLENMHVVNYIKQEEAADKWTLLISTMTTDIQRATPAGLIEMFESSSLGESPDAKFTVLEKSSKIKNSWILFKVETPRFPYDPEPQSQLFYVIQGNTLLFVNYVAVKAKTLDNAFVDKWAKVFKAAKLASK